MMSRKQAQASPPLRVVGADEKATRKKPPPRMTIALAAEKGDRRDYLVAMRARISKTLDSLDTSPRDLAALMRRAAELDKEIRALDVAEEEAEADGAASEDEAWDASAI